MQSQPTPAAGSGTQHTTPLAGTKRTRQHPPFPLAELQERDVIHWNHLGPLIHVYSALQSDASASRLHALRQSAMRARSGKANAEALWEAYYSLSEKAKEAVEVARQRGHLLLCWSGTRALEDALARGAR